MLESETLNKMNQVLEPVKRFELVIGLDFDDDDDDEDDFNHALALTYPNVGIFFKTTHCTISFQQLRSLKTLASSSIVRTLFSRGPRQCCPVDHMCFLDYLCLECIETSPKIWLAFL